TRDARGTSAPGRGYWRTTWSTRARWNSGRSGAWRNRPRARTDSRASTAIRPTRCGTRTSGVPGVTRTDVTPQRYRQGRPAGVPAGRLASRYVTRDDRE